MGEPDREPDLDSSSDMLELLFSCPAEEDDSPSELESSGLDPLASVIRTLFLF